MSADLFQLMVDNVTDYAIFTLDREGVVTTWNPGAERILGYAEDEIVGKPGKVIFTPEDLRAGVVALELSTAAALGRAEDERWHVRKGGGRFWASGILTALRNEQGELIGYVKILRDFTARIRLEETLRRAQHMESLGFLAAGIAHEFNNLLTVVAGNAGLALRRPAVSGDPTLRSMLGDLLRVSERGGRLTAQLLAYAGKGQFEKQPVDLCDEVATVSALVAASVSPEVRLEAAVAPDCPLVEGDPVQLRQLFMNLLQNAAEAIGTGPGAVRVVTSEVTITATQAREQYAGFVLQPGRFVVVEISDTGPGIDPANRPRIFEPFFSTKFQGRGLGLPAALGIVRAHDGALTVSRTPANGALFRVLLPVAEHAVAGQGSPRSPVRHPGVVLVADDEEMIRSLATAILEPVGFTVLHAENGEQAVQMFDRMADEIVTVLLDLAMPVMNGEEALGHLRRRRADVPIVIMSGYGDPETIHRVRGLKVDGFLSKPFTPERLLAALGAEPNGDGAGDAPA